MEPLTQQDLDAERRALLQLVEQWEHQARCRFESAKQYSPEDFGARFIKHGAWNYYNCATELRAVLGIPRPEIPASASEVQN